MPMTVVRHQERFASFNRVNSIVLQAGDRVLLRRGDSWSQELRLTGKGNWQNRIILSAYGNGPRPIISRPNRAFDYCIVINEGSHWDISELDLRSAKIGLFLRYMQTNHNADMTVSNCHFQDMTDLNIDPARYNYEIAWSCGIWVGGQINVFDAYQMNNTVLNGFTVRSCSFQNVITGVSNNWYHVGAPGFRHRLTNFLMEDCVSWGLSQNGIFAFNHASNGVIRRNRVLNGGGAGSTTGITAAFLAHSEHITIDDNEFAYYDRVAGADGTGMDFEGDCHFITFTNNVVHNNDGAGTLFLSTLASNEGIVIENNTFYNNSLDPYKGYLSDWDWEMHSGDPFGTGVVRNCGIYRRSGVRDGRWFSTKWDGVALIGNRLGYYDDVANRPTSWQFKQANNLEGWSGFHQVAWPTVGWDVLSGSATGNDPFFYSPPTWANSHQERYLKIRMAVNQATWAQVFFITETDGVWNQAKSVAFTVNPGGAFHDYSLDMRALCADYKGVITQIRLDPTTVNGDIFWIDSVTLSAQP